MVPKGGTAIDVALQLVKADSTMKAEERLVVAVAGATFSDRFNAISPH